VGYQFTREDVRRTHSEEALQRRRETLAYARQLVREDVLRLWQRGLVPLAIAAAVSRSVSYVSEILRDEGVEIPSYLTTSGPRPEPSRCPNCGHEL
jgi:hypothetical protein